MIKITNLEKNYRTEEVETVALNKLSFSVREGEFVAIMGPSGCGKSTLLNIVGLLDDPDGGSFLFNGEEVAGY
ncbi:MAG: ATP-binding cassette domain-containing protein, partial [Pedobacter sp.]|nr:ATP-binding cassette domain-containing protein [Pedobacter sp.]